MISYSHLGEVGYQSGNSTSIAASGTTSSAIDLRGYTSGAIQLSSEFNGDTITFTGAAFDTDTYAQIYNSGGSVVSFTATTGKWHELPQAVFACGFIKIVTNNATVALASIPISLRCGGGGSQPVSVTSDTELPTAAALADGASNPTTSLIGACCEVFNGTTWDRWPGSTAAGGRVYQGGVVIRPTITTSASPDYAATDVISGIVTLSSVMSASGRSALLKSLVVKDAAGQAPPLSFLFFRATPASGTYTDNANLVWGTNDLANLVGVVRVVALDWYTLVSKSIAAIGDIDQEMGSATSDLYMLIIADGAYNAASTSDLTVELSFEQR